MERELLSDIFHFQIGQLIMLDHNFRNQIWQFYQQYLYKETFQHYIDLGLFWFVLSAEKQNQKNITLCVFQIFERFVNMQSKEMKIVSYMYYFSAYLNLIEKKQFYLKKKKLINSRNYKTQKTRIAYTIRLFLCQHGTCPQNHSQGARSEEICRFCHLNIAFILWLFSLQNCTFFQLLNNMLPCLIPSFSSHWHKQSKMNLF